MDFKELAALRYSCRKLSDRKVDEAIVQKLLEIQRLAPSAYNKQPQRIYLLEGSEVAEVLSRVTGEEFSASLFMVVCYDRAESWKRPFDEFDEGLMDSVIAACHLDLAITEAGLGTYWFTSFDPVVLSQALDLPEHHFPMVVFPVGYPADEERSSSDRRPLSEQVIDRR